MPFKNFTDSRGSRHCIYLQEKIQSCAIACACSLYKLANPRAAIGETEFRALSQHFDGGYRPDVKDIGQTRATFLIRNELVFFKGSDHYLGTRNYAISDLLKVFNLYSEQQALAELNQCNMKNYKNFLFGKIVILTVPHRSGRHSVLIRDVWDDGTIILYDPSAGLIETQGIEVTYRMSEYELDHLASHISFAAYQKQVFALEKEGINAYARPICAYNYEYNAPSQATSK